MRERTLERTLAAVDLGPRSGSRSRSGSSGFTPPCWPARPTGGIAYEELPFPSQALSAQVRALEGFVVPPLPNYLFTRCGASGA